VCVCVCVCEHGSSDDKGERGMACIGLGWSVGTLKLPEDRASADLASMDWISSIDGMNALFLEMGDGQWGPGRC